MANGAIWMVVMRFADRSLGLVSVMILARFLVPGDFGVVAMATSFMALIELFGAFGFDAALIRSQTTTRREFDTAWTLNVALGVGIAVVLIAVSTFVADFYHEDRLPLVIAVLAIGTIIGALENIGVVEFRKQLDFAKEFRFQMMKRLATFAITIPAAFLLQNYWALIGGMVASKVVTTTWSYHVSPYRPRFSFAAAGELVKFSKWLLINNLVGFLKERGFDFIVGRIAGVTALGTFSVAYSLGNLPTTELAGPINRAVFPGYARMANDLAALRSSFKSIMGVIALFVAPAGVGMAAVAPLACLVLLGPKWDSAIPILEIIALQGAVNTLQTNMYSAYLAINKPHVPMWTGAGYVAVLLPLSIWLTTGYGLEGTAWACLITALIFVPVNYGIVLHYLQMHWSAALAVSWRPILSSVVVWFAARAAAQTLGAEIPPLLVLIASIACGAVAYVLVITALWWLSGRPDSAERVLLNRVKSMAGRRQPAPQ